jgi:hypothetical protein
MDAYIGRRKLYWSTSAAGKIYYTLMDAVSPTESALSAIGSWIGDPKGVAIHYDKKLLYWVDGHHIKSSDLTGGSGKLVKTLSTVFTIYASWSSSSATLTVNTIQSGTIYTGLTIYGPGILTGTTISAFGTGTGGVGTYTLSQQQSASGDNVLLTSGPPDLAGIASWTNTEAKITVTSISSGKLSPGQFISGENLKVGTRIVEQITYGVGEYTVSQTQTVASATLTAVGSAVFKATWIGTKLTVISVTSGVIAVGQTIAGVGITTGTTITQIVTGTGGIGVYTISSLQSKSGFKITVTSSSTCVFTGSITATKLTVTAITSGRLAIGQTLTGGGITAGTTLTQLITGGIGI